jgi:hypothetical protein
MTSKMENPAARDRANRVPEIAAIAKPLDFRNPIENPFEFQSELLAVVTVMRRFGIGYHHAQVVCRHSGLGGQHA